ncbi:MAG: hypothetical protein H6Q89_5091 [Myxococcaceae bacterium]|nr:hypothetical protein [Myxococcaceae bacterium]
MPSRWERLLESKPIPIIDHLVEEVSKLFADSLRAWPLEVDEADPAVLAVLEAYPRRPDDGTFREAFRLARWDLDREFEAFDDYIRNMRFVSAGLSPDSRPLLLFLCRFMTEQALGLNEATEGRIDRRRMLQVLERTERLLIRGLLS